MSITVINSRANQKKSIDILSGTVFTGRIANYPERLFMKLYGGMITALDGDKAGTASGVWEGCPVIDDYLPVSIEIRIL